jgi:hypothetical protein
MTIAPVLVAAALAQAPSVSMSGTFVPAQPSGDDAFLFVLQLDSTAPLSGATASIRPRTGFTATKPELDVPQGARKAALVFELRATDAAPAAGDLVATVTDRASGAPLGEGHYTFTYAHLVSLKAFYPLALLGILLGWILKLLVKVNAGRKPPERVVNPFLSPKRVEELRRNGPTESVGFAKKLEESAKLYYLVDGALTLAIGFIALLAMTRDGAAPAAAAHWQGALIVGFGLGVLTPQDLLGKVK